MAPGPRNVMRSEGIEGGLSGPAHPIPDQSLDCGCRQFRFPKLAKYATRKLFVVLICWIGLIQATAHAYFGVTSSTIARRFKFEPNTIEWLSLITDGIAPFVLALPVVYWGDRFHRAAWTGALVLLQSVSFLFLIIPHLTHNSSRIIEETTNVTHHSLFAEDHPDLCSTTGLARVDLKEEETCWFTLSVIIFTQIISCMGNIAYYALAISYLDDNTRKRHVALPIACILSVKIFGMLLGYLIAWGCLRIDAEDLTSTIESYREQIGAWWLAWPIFAVLLAIPGLLLSWLPRRLPSEVVEQAAASILDLAGRTSVLSESTVSEETKKFGDATFLPSMLRLLTNKILLCCIFASVFCTVALINFAANEDIFLESRFYVPRPAGLLLGFGDPLTSRIVSLMLRPIIIGVVIIISGVVIVKLRPRAKWLVCYNIIIGILAAMIIVSLAFANCQKPPIAGANRGGSINLLKYCNKNCRCSKDANFRPVCDSKNSFTFYTPCHAGCTGIDGTRDVRTFTGCRCIEEVTGLLGNNEATEGPCGSTCQYGWILFEVNTIVAYSLVASGAVASLLVSLRSTYTQDKALAIGLWITLVSFFTYIPGKMLYWQITDWTCVQRGNSKALCHLHDSNNLGAYLAYLTTVLLIIGVFFEILAFIFCQNLRLYRDSELETTDLTQAPSATLPLVIEELPREDPPQSTDEIIDFTLNTPSQIEESTSAVSARDAASLDHPKTNGPLKYGPLGPGDRRTVEDTKNNVNASDSDEEDYHPPSRRAPISLSTISYRRLELDSEAADASDSSAGSQRQNYRRTAIEVIQKSAERPISVVMNDTVAGFSRTDDIEFTKFAKKPNDKKERPYTGDFNEVGIPIVEYPTTSMNSKSIGSIFSSPKVLEEVKMMNLRKKEAEEAVGVDRSLSPVEQSSGFGSSASDLHKIPSDDAKSKEISRAKTYNRKLPAYSTAL